MMFQTLKLKRIVGFARGSRTGGAEVMDSSRVQTWSLGFWALIALVPSSLVVGIASCQLRPRSQFAVGLAAGAEVSAFSRASALEPESEVASPDRSATASADATRPVESHDPRPMVEEARPTVQKPDVTPEPVLVVTRPSPAEEIALGRALFDRRWRPGDPRCHNGDGLGPVFNATSCLDCHREGGPGGGGPVRTNAQLVTVLGKAFPKPQIPGRFQSDNGARYVVLGFPGRRIGDDAQTDLVNLHPGFADAPSVVLHLFGVDPGYDQWRQRLSIALVAHTMEIEAPRKVFQAGLVKGLSDPMALHLTGCSLTASLGAGQIDAAVRLGTL